MLTAIADSRVRDASVNIPGFGAFSTKRRSARQGRHPRTGETITIAASQVRCGRSRPQSLCATRSSSVRLSRLIGAETAAGLPVRRRFRARDDRSGVFDIRRLRSGMRSAVGRKGIHSARAQHQRKDGMRGKIHEIRSLRHPYPAGRDAKPSWKGRGTKRTGRSTDVESARKARSSTPGVFRIRTMRGRTRSRVGRDGIGRVRALPPVRRAERRRLRARVGGSPLRCRAQALPTGHLP